MGHVLSDAKKDPTTNWPRLTCFTSRPTSSTTPQYSWPIGVGPFGASMPRYGHRSEPQTQVADRRMMTSVGSTIVGSSRSTYRTSCGPYSTAPFMCVSPSLCARHERFHRLHLLRRVGEHLAGDRDRRAR